MSSVVNSSSTPLAGDAEFPGAWEFLTVDKHGVEVVCSTDAPGNLIIEFSQDKTTINYSHTYTIEADVSFSRAVSKKGNYYKVRLVNGASAQTTLQLVSIIQTTYQPDTLDVELNSATSSITIFGQDSDGTKRVVKTTTDGSLVISGGGGGGGGDATAANQVASNTAICARLDSSNLAVCSRLDTIDVSANNMEVQLDKLTFTTGNLHVRDDRALTELQGSNLAQYTKLGLIAEAAEDTLISVDGINAKLNALQLQSAKYTIEAAASLAPGITPAFTTPPSGIEKSEGWYFKNTSTGQPSQVYYYSYTNPALQVAGRQFAYQLNDISCGYCVVRLLAVNASSGLPFMGVYTRPTGSGDAAPGFYKSRKVYTIPNTAKLTQGMRVFIWWGIQPSLKLHPDVARVELELASTTGTAAGTELLAYLTVNSDSAALAGNAEYIISAAGFQFAAAEIMDSTFTGESSAITSAGDASAANQLASNTAICARLDSANLTITNSNLALTGGLTTLSSNIGQLYYTGSNLQVQDIKLSSELSSLNTTIGQGIYVNMETDPVVSGGVKLHGSTDGNLWVYDASVNNELIALNGVMGDLISGDAQMYVRLDGTDDSVQILTLDQSTLAPTPLYSVDNKLLVSGSVDVNNQITGFSLEETQLEIKAKTDQLTFGDASSLLVQGEFFQANQPVQFETPQDVNLYASDFKLTSTQTGESQFSLDVNVNNLEGIPVSVEQMVYTGTSELTVHDAESLTELQTVNTKLIVCDTNNVEVPNGLDVMNFPTSFQIENKTGTSIEITTSTPLDTNIYAVHNGTPVQVVAASSGHLLVNSTLETDANGSLTSENVTGTETYNALHSWIKNPSINVNARGYAATESAFVPIAVDEDGKVATTLSGAVNVQNVSGTELEVKAKQYGSYGNLANNIPSILPGSATTGINVADWSYFVGYYEDYYSGPFPSGSLRIQYSFDNITYYNIFNTQIFPSGTGTPRTATVSKQDIPGINWIRFYNDTDQTMISVSITLMGGSLA